MSISYPAGEALTCRQIREYDVLAIEHVGIPGIVLMENAGRAAAGFIYDHVRQPGTDRVLILCGPGNNGGDGFVIARHLHNAGVSVQVVLAAAREKSRGDAGTNLAIVERMGLVPVEAFEPAGMEVARRAATEAAVIVDALLGTGSSGAPRGTIAALIELANAAPHARRIAIDIPSGLDADSGEVREPCFRASATVTMVAPKVGFEKPAAGAVVGTVVAVDIGGPRGMIPGRESVAPGVDS